MGLLIGRFDLGDGVDYSSIRTVEDTWTVSGVYTGDDVDTAACLRDALNALPDDGRPVMTVQWDVDDRYTGFWRPIAAEVSETPNSLANAGFRWSLTLEKVSTFTEPLVELSYIATRRANAGGVTAANGVEIAYPSGSDIVIGAGVNNMATESPRPTEDGLTYIGFTAGGGVTSTVSGVVSGRMDVSTFNWGEARLEVNRNGVWHHVIGRQVPRGFADKWRLTNGVIRLGPLAGSTGEFVVEAWRAASSQWVQVATVRGSLGSTNALNLGFRATSGWSPPAVRVNTADQVSVQVTAGAIWQTITLRRGCRHAEITMTNIDASPSGGQPGLVFTDGKTPSTVTNGRLSASDPNGFRVYLGALEAFTTRTDGFFLTTARVRSDVSVFCVAAAPDTVSAGEFAEDFVLAASCETRVVARA